jgi:hypothetical protein
MFEKSPDEGRIRSSFTGLAADSNAGNIERYLMEQVFDMDVQFNRIPDLKRVDDLLQASDKDVGEAVEEVNETSEATR